MKAFGARAWRWALVAGSIALLVAIAADRWYAGQVRAHERDRLLARLQPYAAALHSAIDRRFSVLLGFHAFVSSRRSRAVLEEEFAVYARGARASTSGVRALEYVDRGRVVRIEPLAGSEGALNLDMANDPDPRMRASLASALSATRPFVTGPLALREGGVGILLRQRLVDRPGFPQVVAVVLDAPAMVRDAGIPEPSGGVRLTVVNIDGEWMGGAPLESLQDPVSVEIAFEGETWRLLGMPEAGWSGATRDWNWSFRLALALIVLLAGLIAFTVGDRLDRLTLEMEHSGSALEVAMRAGGTGAWSLDLGSDRVHVSGATTALLGIDESRAHDALVVAFDQMPPEDRQETQRLFDQARAGRRDAFATEFRFVRSSGGVRQILCLGQLVRDGAMEPRSLIGILTDVTGRRAMEEGLRRAERAESVGKLAGGVAHDFNNLLTAITGFAELVAGHVADDRSQAALEISDDMTRVLHSAEEGARLTTQLLAFSRRAPTDVGRVDLGLNIANLQPVLMRLFAGRIAVLVEVADDLPVVRAESGLLTQVILTLLVRARDTVPGPERVRLRATFVPSGSGKRPLDAPLGEWVCLEIIEEGERRVKPSDQPRRPTPAGGLRNEELGDASALGLAVIASGIESAGGRLTVAVGARGATTARVFLPLWADSP